MSQKKRYLNSISITLALLVLLFFAYLRISREVSSTPAESPVATQLEAITTDTDEYVNYTAPSTEERSVQDKEKTNTALPEDVIEEKEAPTIGQTVSITDAHQEFSVLVIMTKLTGDHWIECELELVKEDELLNLSAEALYQESFSTCLGFEVNIEDLNQGGEWTLRLTATKDDGTKVTSEDKLIEVVK